MKNILLIIGVIVILVGGFLAINSYIYNEKQADFVVGETVEVTGQVLNVDMTQIALDGPYLITLSAEDMTLYTIAVPSMGLPLCPAYTALNIGDVSLIKPGDEIEVRGKVGEDGSIVPCESAEDYLRPTPIVVDGFEGEADPSKMNLGMKKWVWQYTLYNDGREVKPTQSEAFTITFEDNTFSATTDCNGVGGNFKANNGSITFTEMMSTLMYCEGSQESEFTAMLTNTSSYHFTSRGELVLSLKFDSGSVVFR